MSAQGQSDAVCTRCAQVAQSVRLRTLRATGGMETYARAMAKQRKPALRQLSEDRSRYIPSGIDQLEDRLQTAKIFKNGRSQAVRLPKEFRFEGDEVYVRREGKSVVLTPKAAVEASPWKDFFEALDMFDPALPLERNQPTGHQVRKSIEEWSRPRRKRSKKAT